MYFKKCGVVHEDPAVFCKQCSYQSNVQPVMQGNVSQSVGMQDTPVKKSAKKKRVLIVCGVLLMCMAATVFFTGLICP